MPDWLTGWPFLAVLAFFVCGAALRSQATYWAGRGLAAGVLRSRWADRLDRDRLDRAVAVIERWGMPVVPLSFLTVGFQSAVHGAAGLLGIGWLRYTLWAVPGWFLWALLWAGGGMAAVAGAVVLAARSPWALAAAALGLVGLVALLLRLTSRTRRDRRNARRSDAGPRRTGSPPGR